MDLYFQSFRSGSSGNCLMLWSAGTALLFDCGIKTQRDCRQLLAPHQEAGRRPAVVLSHAHTDHLHSSALKVLQERQVPIHAHAAVLQQVKSAHAANLGTESPRLVPFPHSAFEIDDFLVQPVEVPHAPGFPNFAFVVHHRAKDRPRKMVFCTDCFELAPILEHLINADFIFVEANHDLQLLRLYPNYSSRYHLSNPKTASLLYHAVRRSQTPPQAVMLGHLSRERNREELALNAVQEVFERQRLALNFTLTVAPRLAPSRLIRIQ